MKTRKLNVVETAPQAPTRYTADYMLESLKRRLEREKESATNAIHGFAERFAVNPANALEWSDKVFTYAAMKEACEGIESFIRRQEEKDMYEVPSSRKLLDMVQDMLLEETLNRAQYPESSTSVPSNLMSLRRNAARAEWCRRVRDAIEMINA